MTAPITGQSGVVTPSPTTTSDTINAGRRRPPLVNPFRLFVTNELLRRRATYPTPTITPFVRMTSCLQSEAASTQDQYRYFTLGLHGFDSTSTDMFDLTYGSAREVVGYAYRRNNRGTSKVLIDASQLPIEDYSQLARRGIINEANAERLNTAARESLARQGQNQMFSKGTHPVPGIIKIDVNRFAMGAGIVCNVTWQCYNRQQLEFLRHHFMTAGTNVVIEWGNAFSEKPSQIRKILDFTSSDIDTILANAFVKGRKWVMQEYCYPNNGNYDFMVGTVGNFQVQLEAETNIYKIITTVYSSGEYLWGLRIPNTITTLTDSEQENRRARTFEEYFSYGSAFDQFIQDNKETPIIAHTGEAYSVRGEGDAETDHELEEVSTNPNDYFFISWRGFTQDLMRDMLGILGDNDTLRADIQAILEFSDREEDGLAETDRLWVGNNPYLKSTNPETLVLMRSGMNVSAFSKAGYFDQSIPNSTSDSSRASLNYGVWLNCHMVRDCFLQATTLEQAIRSVLIRMNNAVLGYWNLQIYFDEDTGKYSIIDQKYEKITQLFEMSRDIPFYRFNAGTQGECLNINLDTAFPPEVVTQLALTAKLKSDPAFQSQADDGSVQTMTSLMRRYPQIGAQSFYALAMNWTSLRSTLDGSIANLRQEQLRARGYSEGEIPSSIRRMISESAMSRMTAAGATSDEARTAITDVPVVNENEVPETSDARTPETVSRATPPTITPLPPLTQSEPSSLPSELTHEEVIKVRSLLPCVQHIFVNHFNLMKQRNKRLRIVSAFRSHETQARIYRDTINARTPEELQRRGLAGYAAPPGQSPHEFGLAYDANYDGNPRTPEGWRIFGETAQQAGGVWGGNFTPRRQPGGGLKADEPHVQHPSARDIKRQLRQVEDGMAAMNIVNFGSSYRPTIQGTTVAPTQPSDATLRSNEEQRKRMQETMEDYMTKFGNSIATLVEVNKTWMLRSIMIDGLENHERSRMSNAFIAPFPTTAKISISVVGISGISIFDGFIVDKLPYLYEDYGIFHVTEMKESIDSKGWKTSLSGIFRFLVYTADASTQINAVPARTE